MPTLRERGMTWHASKKKTGAGVSATIRRRSDTLTVTGWVSMLDYEVINDGILTLVRYYDWSFLASDLADLMPQRGDEITATIQGVERLFTVQPIPTGKDVEHKDGHGIELIVHTKDHSECQPS